ncbi:MULTISPECIES: ROK family protein [unclassified Yoonia]|uniref:ROK family protein n=1 Tax=unclassified Yoonia TaxID=2629118 RepID=UPI002AFFDE5D|nr:MULTISPECIES: ROK family protein [unclassified Yoonia]
MIALGIDLGGTKIEAQVFDADWALVERRRVGTPDSYPALCAALQDLALWADQIAGQPLPIGIGAAGAVNPRDGLVLAANLAATGQPLPSDLSVALDRPVTYLNDSRALALSEAVFGAGRSYDSVFALVLGTGVGGGFVQSGMLQGGVSGTGGEVGHIAAPAHLVQRHGLPVLDCPCGRQGCIETLISGAGLARIATMMTGRALTAPQIIAARGTDRRMQAVWRVWCALTADLIQTLTLTLDPACIVLGGGMSDIPDLASDLTIAVAQAQFQGFASPVILRAAGGAESGARGAAYAAWQVAHG